MGEYADMAVADSLDAYWGSDYDEMDKEDSDWAPYGRRYTRSIPTCKICKKSHLYWRTNGDRWVLSEWNGVEYTQHTCSFKGKIGANRISLRRPPDNG